MKKSTGNIMKGIGTVVFAAALGAVYHSTVKYLIKLAIDREGPKNIGREKGKMMGSKEFSEILNVAIKAKDKLENLGCEEVEIVGHDGTRLVGHWRGCENAERIIIAMHGWRSSWAQDFGMISDFWFDNRCAVLFAEQRGQGYSGGDYMGFGLLERYDCLEWANWADKKTESKLPIYLCGISMGATTVLMTGGFDLPKSVHGIIADCGFTAPHAIWKHVVNNKFHMPYGLYGSAANDLFKRKLHVTSDSYSTLEAVKKCSVPILFIHGTDDRFVPIDMTYENYKACTAPKRLFVVPGAEHGMSYLVDRYGYEEVVKHFWHDFDGGNVGE